MFWRYNALTSHIDTLLEKENVTLHELMDEDDILQECKGQNQKLIEFLVTPECMEELVKLVTCEPSEDVEDKVKYKYPNIACELLTSDVSQILDKLIEDNLLIDKIYTFLLSEGELNPLLASFFTKVLGLLLVRKADYLFDYLTSKDDFLGHLLSHLGTSAIMDLLMRLVTYDPMYETKAKILKVSIWMDEENLIEKLVKLIHPDQDEEMHSNAATTLCDIVKFGREQLGTEVPQQDPLLDKVECDSILSILLENMLDGQTRNESVITNGLLVLQTIMEYKRQISSFDDWRPLPEGCIEPLPQTERLRMEKAVTSVLKSVKPRIGQLAKLLTEPPEQHVPRMTTTVGVLDPPLGNTRLQVAKLFATLFAVDDHDLHICLIEHNVINKLLDLFFHYVWNNFLHTQIEISISNILSEKSTAEDDRPKSLTESNTTAEGEAPQLPTTVTQEEDTPLVTHLFKDCNIVSRMLEAWQSNEEAVKSGAQRRGYMGHVTKICNDLVSASEKGCFSALINSLITELPEDFNSKWTDLVANQLAETNKRNTSDLVGGHPLNSSSGSDSDSDFKDIPFPQDDTMQQAFSDYQMQQLTSTFIDQFGLSDEEFGKSSSRIDSPYSSAVTLSWPTEASEHTPKEYEEVCEMDGGSDDEEDMWKDKVITFESTHTTNSTSKGLEAPNKIGGSDDEDDDSSSSDEELSSPVIIRSSDNAMDVDTLSDVITGAPVAMDTSPWDTAATKSGGEDEEWTAFEGATNADNAADAGGWADFTNLDNAPASDGGPRVSSPDALIDPQSASSNTPPADISSGIKSVDNNQSDNSDNVSSLAADTENSQSDSLNESIEQAPLSDDEEQVPADQKQAPASNEQMSSKSPDKTGDITTSNTDMEVDDQAASKVQEPNTNPSLNTSEAKDINLEGMAGSSEIEITVPTDMAAGGDSPKNEKSVHAESNGPITETAATGATEVTGPSSTSNGPIQ